MGVPHSLSLAWRLGRAVLDARQGKGDAVHAVAKAGGGCVVHSGEPEIAIRTALAFFVESYRALGIRLLASGSPLPEPQGAASGALGLCAGGGHHGVCTAGERRMQCIFGAEACAVRPL